MKKLFSFLFVAAMFGMALVSCGSDDEPGKTASPEIRFTVFDNFVTVVANGKGEVNLYNELTKEALANPVNFTRTFGTYTLNVCATAKEEGKEISNISKATITVPQLDSPKVLSINSVHGSDTETYYHFNIDLNKDKSTIEIYNIVFTIGEVQSPAMNIRIDAPANYNSETNTLTFSGSDIIPFMIRGGSLIPMEGETYRVNNLACTVNFKENTFSIAFDCHGGHHDDTGKLQCVSLF